MCVSFLWLWRRLLLQFSDKKSLILFYRWCANEHRSNFAEYTLFLHYCCLAAHIFGHNFLAQHYTRSGPLRMTKAKLTSSLVGQCHSRCTTFEYYLVEIWPSFSSTYFSYPTSEDILCYCTASPRRDNKMTQLYVHHSPQHPHHLTEPPGVVGLGGVRGMTNRSIIRTVLIGSRPEADLHLLGNFLV